MTEKIHLQYITDELGNKTAVIVPINQFEEMLEDLEDLGVMAERRNEPITSHEDFLAELKEDGLL